MVDRAATARLIATRYNGFSGLSVAGQAKVVAYMQQSMLDEHAALFESGVARVQPNLPTGTIGRTETWVMPKPFADRAIAEAGGDVGKLERLLEGYLGSSPVRVDIPQPAGLRMSSGN